MKKVLLVCAVMALTACTDAKLGKIAALGSSGHVKCYSGTSVIYDGDSTGKIANSEQSDGYYFVDKTTQELVEVSGNCIVTYK